MKPLPQVLFATTNTHKIRLFKICWSHLELDKKYELVTLDQLHDINLGHIEENSGTFEGDALIKAKAYAKAYNMITISQDRGFVFEALNWPGTDSKKVFTLDEQMHFNKESWNARKDLYFERSKEILDRINGLDRSMSVIQGLAAALPNGVSVTQKHETKGNADTESRVSVSGSGGMHDWFFVPNGLNHTISEFQTVQEQDNYCALQMYPITPKIIKFLQTNLG